MYYTKRVCFSIAGIKFLYIFDSFRLICNNTPYTDFLCQKGNMDVVNNISFLSQYMPLSLSKTCIISSSPSWTIYLYHGISIAEFHPNGTYVGTIKSNDNWSTCWTEVIDGFSATQLLPICMTGFLCQQAFMRNKTNCFFMHGATVSMGDKNIILTGNSGVGKSTLSRLLREHLNCPTITDDRFILRVFNDEYYSCGNPFDMNNSKCRNKMVRIHAMYFLGHGAINEIIPINGKDRIRHLLKIAMIPYFDRKMIEPCTSILNKIAHTIPMYSYYFTPDVNGCLFLFDYERITSNHLRKD